MLQYLWFYKVGSELKWVTMLLQYIEEGAQGSYWWSYYAEPTQDRRADAIVASRGDGDE